MAPETVVDPVCKMTLNPAAAAARLDHAGERFFFCSLRCRDRFAADPGSYAAPVSRPKPATCHAPAGGDCPKRRALGRAARGGALGAAGLLSLYFGVLTLASGWDFATSQFAEFWPYIVALAGGFGVQVGLFLHLHRAMHAPASGKVMATTGTTSGLAMVSCCAHYLVALLPALGATGLVGLINDYQVELFWFGLAANAAGILYMGRHLGVRLQGA
jgi:YHS domain-containing protein